MWSQECYLVGLFPSSLEKILHFLLWLQRAFPNLWCEPREMAPPQEWGQMFNRAVKTPLQILRPYLYQSVSLRFQLPAYVHPERQQVMAQVLGLCIQVGYLDGVLGSWYWLGPSPGCCKHLGNETTNERFSISLYISNKLLLKLLLLLFEPGRKDHLPSSLLSCSHPPVRLSFSVLRFQHSSASAMPLSQRQVAPEAGGLGSL